MLICCSYDSRGKVSESGSHWSNSTVIGNRAFFRIRPEPATLIIEDLKESDAGSYRCRVDFQKSPTKNNKIRLQVVSKYQLNTPLHSQCIKIFKLKLRIIMPRWLTDIIFSLQYTFCTNHTIQLRMMCEIHVSRTTNKIILNKKS